VRYDKKTPRPNNWKLNGHRHVSWRLTALIGQRPHSMGVQSIDALKAATEGKPVQNVDTGVDVVTADNVDEFIKK